MTARTDVRAQLDRASGLIDTFRRSAEAGMAIDLTGLDRSVAAMCDAIAALPPDQRPPLKDSLVALMDEMNALVAAIEAQQQEVSDSLKGVSSRQRAVAAYGKGVTPGRPGKNPRTK
jgi:hypothetical protein